MSRPAPRPRHIDTNPRLAAARRGALLWSSVSPEISRALIIASGPSAKQPWAELLPDDLPVIAVSGAITGLPRANYWFTLDPSPANKALMAEPMPGVKYVAAVPYSFGDYTARPSTLRGPIHSHVTYLRRISRKGLPETSDTIHTGNSGHGAFQLALHLGARKIGIVGIDCTQDHYWYGKGAPGKLTNLPHTFRANAQEVANRGVRVRIGSIFPSPRLDCWPAMSPADVVAWLMQE